jgi:hypothetical protein
MLLIESDDSVLLGLQTLALTVELKDYPELASF